MTSPPPSPPATPFLVSVIVPVYNEGGTLRECLRWIFERNPDLALEVLVVDDGSDPPVEGLAEAFPGRPIVFLRHPRNLGKGAAIRTALAAASGEVVLIQDADLEYDPADYARLLAPLAAGAARVVYGSRIRRSGNPASYARYYWGGRFLSFWTNLLFGSRITDEPTCYKVFRTDLLRSLDLACAGFEFCPEVTAKILRRRIPIVEVPISYRPRTMAEGKKIRWRDGVVAVWTLLKFRVKP